MAVKGLEIAMIDVHFLISCNPIHAYPSPDKQFLNCCFFETSCLFQFKHNNYYFYALSRMVNELLIIITISTIIILIIINKSVIFH